MNWLDPRSRTQINMIRHYHRVLKMDDSRLTKKILKYDLVFVEMGTKDCWSTEVKNILNRNNLGHIFSTFPFNIKSTIETLTQSLLIKDQTKWKTTSNDMPKLRTYVKLDDFFCNKQFISKPLTFIQRKFLSKFRLGVLPIRIEVGRYERPPLAEAERVCRACNEPDAVENETHFLLKCPAYERLRRDLFAKAMDWETLSLTWDDNQKLRFLTCDPEMVKPTGQFIADAFDYR